MFRRPTIRYGQTAEPVTPYQRAAQVWDDRIGSARVQAKNWRLAFFGALALSGGSPAPAAEASGGSPAWAAAMRRRQTMTHGATVAAHTLRSGDSGGGGSSVDLSQKD